MEILSWLSLAICGVLAVGGLALYLHVRERGQTLTTLGVDHASLVRRVTAQDVAIAMATRAVAMDTQQTIPIAPPRAISARTPAAPPAAPSGPRMRVDIRPAPFASERAIYFTDGDGHDHAVCVDARDVDEREGTVRVDPQVVDGPRALVGLPVVSHTGPGACVSVLRSGCMDLVHVRAREEAAPDSSPRSTIWPGSLFSPSAPIAPPVDEKAAQEKVARALKDELAHLDEAGERLDAALVEATEYVAREEAGRATPADPPEGAEDRPSDEPTELFRVPPARTVTLASEGAAPSPPRPPRRHTLLGGLGMPRAFEVARTLPAVTAVRPLPRERDRGQRRAFLPAGERSGAPAMTSADVELQVRLVLERAGARP